MRPDKTTGFTMEDICDAMEAIQIESGGKVSLDCELYGSTRGRQRVVWTATLVAIAKRGGTPQSYTASQGWPTNSHRTVLGLLWSLLHTVDQEFQAAVMVANM